MAAVLYFGDHINAYLMASALVGGSHSLIDNHDHCHVPTNYLLSMFNLLLQFANFIWCFFWEKIYINNGR